MPAWVSLCVSASVGANVVQLSDATFDDAIAKHAFAVVSFRAPWCQRSDSLLNTMGMLPDLPSQLFAEVDCVSSAGLADRFVVKQYPTVLLFRDGKSQEYKGDYDMESVGEVVRAGAQPCRPLQSEAELVAFSKKLTGLVAFVSRADGARVVEEFATEQAGAFPAAVAEGWSETQLAAIGGRQDHVMFLRPTHTLGRGESRVALAPLTELTTLDKLREWLRTSLPVVMSADVGVSRYFQDLQGPLNRTVTAVSELPGPIAPGIARYLANRLKAAIGQQSGYAMRVEGGGRFASGALAERFGIQFERGFAVVVEDGELRYGCKPTTAGDAFSGAASCLAGIAAGTIRPHRRSAVAPASSRPVKVLTADTFDTFVRGSGRPVFVLFHVQWCGHCARALPEWERLAAKELAVTVATYDCSENDLPPGVGVATFPTFMWLGPGQTTGGAIYTGERRQAGWQKFIAMQLDPESDGEDWDSDDDPRPEL
mmetsp:Transcript_41756/g.100204  ORF Transcript_41756/g.100204 Transcript_41756/m.100204 type:complete len:483 (+) Transcript_41756:20-1468(+)